MLVPDDLVVWVVLVPVPAVVEIMSNCDNTPSASKIKPHCKNVTGLPVIFMIR